MHIFYFGKLQCFIYFCNWDKMVKINIIVFQGIPADLIHMEYNSVCWLKHLVVSDKRFARYVHIHVYVLCLCPFQNSFHVHFIHSRVICLRYFYPESNTKLNQKIDKLFQSFIAWFRILPGIREIRDIKECCAIWLKILNWKMAGNL